MGGGGGNPGAVPILSGRNVGSRAKREVGPPPTASTVIPESISEDPGFSDDDDDAPPSTLALQKTPPDGSPRDLVAFNRSSKGSMIQSASFAANCLDVARLSINCSTRLFGVLSDFHKQQDDVNHALLENSCKEKASEEDLQRSREDQHHMLIDQRTRDREFLKQIGVAMDKNHSARRLPVVCSGPCSPSKPTAKKHPAIAAFEKPGQRLNFNQQALIEARAQLAMVDELNSEEVEEPEKPKSLLRELLPHCGPFRKIDVKDRICEKFRLEQLSDFMRQEVDVVVDENGSRKIVHTNPAMTAMCRLLRQIGLFKEYTDGQLGMLVRNMLIKRKEANQWLFHKGDNPQDATTGGFYVIIHGSITVHLEDDQPAVATFGVGSSFGDKALLTDQPRNASIFTAEPCIFGVIRKDDFVRYRHHADQIWASSVARFLQTTSAFSHWEMKSLVCFSGMSRSKWMEPGKVFFASEDAHKTVLIIRSGEVEVVRTMRSKRKIALPRTKARAVYQEIENSTRLVVTRLQRGDVFGDNAALTTDEAEALRMKEALQDCEFVAVSPGEALLIDVENFRRCCKKWGYTVTKTNHLLSVEELAQKAEEKKNWKKFRKEFVRDIMMEKDSTTLTAHANGSGQKTGLISRLWRNGGAMTEGSSVKNAEPKPKIKEK